LLPVRSFLPLFRYLLIQQPVDLHAERKASARGSLNQRLDTGRGVAVVRVLHGHADDRARLEIGRMLRIVSQVHASILHLTDLRGRIVRMRSIVVRTFFLRLRSIRVPPSFAHRHRRQSSTRDRSCRSYVSVLAAKVRLDAHFVPARIALEIRGQSLLALGTQPSRVDG
jgi:hypothetical protein